MSFMVVMLTSYRPVGLGINVTDCTAEKKKSVEMAMTTPMLYFAIEVNRAIVPDKQASEPQATLTIILV